MSLTEAEQALYQDLLSIYARAGAEVTYETEDGKIKPYWAKRFLQAVKRAEKNGELFEFVDRLLRPAQPSRGFLILKKAGRLDLTVEALVIDSTKPYYGEIPFELIAIARRRLAEHGYRAAFEREPTTPAELASAEQPITTALSPGSSFDLRVTVGEDGHVSLAVI
jgi:hypothetical protein